MSSDVDMQAQHKSKQQKWEEIQAMKRKAEEQLRLVAMEEQALKTNSDSSDIDNISARLGRSSLNGPVSEPTTPPEYAEGTFSSSRYSRSSRLSANSIMSPPGFGNRLSQASSQITSPAGRLSGSMTLQANRASTKSMPGSRRGSDEEEDYAQDLPNIRPPGRYVNLHRFILRPPSSALSLLSFTLPPADLGTNHTGLTWCLITHLSPNPLQTDLPDSISHRSSPFTSSTFIKL